MKFLPLHTYANIIEGNALRIDWESVVPKSELNYILGNPPFVGARWMSKEQKKDVLDIFGSKWNGVGDLDYVCCWYKKAAEYIQNTEIKTALVSTNSITQGGAVTNLWKPLFENYNIHIDFAWRTFQWDSEANIKAHVHCVIVGFSCCNTKKQKTIYLNESQSVKADNINGYLLNAQNIFIEKRMKPLSDVPEICLGGQAIDDGNLVLTLEEKNELLKKEPNAEKFFRPYMMGKDFIDRKPRACLWLIGANPSELKKCPLILKRVENVKIFREKSDRTSTLKAAATPTLFAAPFECKNDYIAIPKVSSEQRRYIPMDYLSKEIIPGDKLFTMQNASLFHFGVMTSNVHNAWMRAVAGRLKSDYSYSNTIVYNNFPWPKQFKIDNSKLKMENGKWTLSGEDLPADKKELSIVHSQLSIINTAQAILDARAKYPDSSLADLYDETLMPPELRKAHQANDRAVMAAYGFSTKMTESECVAELFKLYESLTKSR